MMAIIRDINYKFTRYVLKSEQTEVRFFRDFNIKRVDMLKAEILMTKEMESTLKKTKKKKQILYFQKPFEKKMYFTY